MPPDRELNPARARGRPPGPARTAFGKWLRTSRERRGYSVRAAAAELGCSGSQLSRMEAGVCKPSVQTLYLAANLYGVDCDALAALVMED